MPKRKNKNQSYRFKTKEERDKKIEDGAIKYLQNDYKNKNKLDNKDFSKNKPKKQTSLKKKIYNKSVNSKMNDKDFDNAKNKKQNKLNSNTTKTSSNSEYLNKFVKNDSLSINSSYNNNKNNNNEHSVFQNEFQKIMKFNKKLRNDSQENRANQKYLNYNNSDENDHICTDCQYSKYKECKNHRDLHSMPKKYMNNIRNTENDEKKYFVKFNPNKKYNGI